MGNTCILCALLLLLEQNIPMYESNEELRIKKLVLFYFSRLCNQSRNIFGRPKNKKDAQLSWQEPDNADTGCG